VVLSTHVHERLVGLGLTAGKIVLRTTLPPHTLDLPPPPPRAHGGKLRVLFFGRLLDYKGLDLLAEALAMILPRPDIEVRIVGNGPESEDLETLRGLPGVSVENRWVPEDEVGTLLAWSDAIVMTHREASQSGVAAAGLAARRWIVSTRIGGIAEQLQGQPGAILCDINAGAIAAGLLRLLENPPEAASMAPPDWQKDAAQLAEDLKVKLRKKDSGSQNP
jgi:glycosyltransferase involved in cell wall biosynthesis